MKTIVVRENEITLSLLEPEDQAHLVKWLSDPVVLEFYEGRDRPHDLELVQAHFYEEASDATRCIITVDDKAIGYLQFYPIDEEEREIYGYGDSKDLIYGMDQFIGEPDYWGRGYGRRVVRSVVQYLFDDRRANRVVLDPEAWNLRAIACYERVGFRKKKWLPLHELHEGELRDCWLMEIQPV